MFPFMKKEEVLGFPNCFSYACFMYEKLTLFCFLCGYLGHSDSFCSIRSRMDVEGLKLKWDISLRV